MVSEKMRVIYIEEKESLSCDDCGIQLGEFIPNTENRDFTVFCIECLDKGEENVKS